MMTPGPWIYAFGDVYRDNNEIRIAIVDRNEPGTSPTERDAALKQAEQWAMVTQTDPVHWLDLATAALTKAGQHSS